VEIDGGWDDGVADGAGDAVVGVALADVAGAVAADRSGLSSEQAASSVPAASTVAAAGMTARVVKSGR
jgi:hypothetical protein